MALKHKVIKINTTNIVSSSKMFMSTYGGRTIFSTQWKARDNNAIWSSPSSYQEGSAVISKDGMRVDDNLILTVGWNGGVSGGFAVRRIETNGSLTLLYHDDKPANSYGYYTSIALDTVHGVAYVGNQVYDNITEYDYSAFQNNGSGPVTKGRNLTEAANDLPSDEVGRSYNNGIEVVGDFLYFVSDDKVESEAYRWHIPTETKMNISVINKRNDGRYGTLNYFPDSNRLYISFYDNGETWVIANPDKFAENQDASWVLPTSHNDPAGVWTNPEKVYNGDTSDYGYVDPTPPINTYSDFFEMYITSQYCDRVHIFLSNMSNPMIDLDLYYDGEWHDTLVDVPVSADPSAGTVLYFEERYVTRIRFRLKGSNTNIMRVNNFKFFGSTTSYPDTAKAFCLRVKDSGISLGDDGRVLGAIEDPDNNNYLWVGGNYRVGKVDITNSLNPNDPQIPVALSGSSSNTFDYPYHLSAYGWELSSPDPIYKGNLIIMYPMAGWIQHQGWWDQDNNMPVAAMRVNEWYNSEDSLRYDYGGARCLATASNGTKYWVYTGYGNADGHRFHVFSEDKGNVLELNSEIIFGTLSFDDSADIGAVNISNLEEGIKIPTECSANYYLSNNNGSTWEACTIGQTHEFESMGSQLRFKVSFSGTAVKAPHFQINDKLTFVLFGKQNTKNTSKIINNKVKGAAITYVSGGGGGGNS